jgi:hypothetical protein
MERETYEMLHALGLLDAETMHQWIREKALLHNRVQNSFK